MLALQYNGHGSMMGLGVYGMPLRDAAATANAVEQSIATRVAAIRAKMITLGIPLAVGTGAVTMLGFAGAFGLARTERVWAPAIWLGALATIGGLISVAMAAKVSSDAAADQAAAAAATTTTTTPTTLPPPIDTTAQAPVDTTTAPAAFGYYRY